MAINLVQIGYRGSEHVLSPFISAIGYSYGMSQVNHWFLLCLDGALLR